MRQAVQGATTLWSDACGVRFVEVEQGADVAISFDGDSSLGYYATATLPNSTDDQAVLTTYPAFFKNKLDVTKRIALLGHEFGHLLGFDHEQLNDPVYLWKGAQELADDKREEAAAKRQKAKHTNSDAATELEKDANKLDAEAEHALDLAKKIKPFAEAAERGYKEAEMNEHLPNVANETDLCLGHHVWINDLESYVKTVAESMPLTVLDRQSIMHYRNTGRTFDKLPECDRLGARKVYGPPFAGIVCVQALFFGLCTFFARW